MNHYYLISSKEQRQVASAFAPQRTKLNHELIQDLNGVSKMPFELYLVKLSVGKNGLIESDDLTGLNEIWLDYLPNSLAWPFFSDKLKDVVDKSLTGKEGIDWITAKVNGNGEQKEYYIPRFEKMLDVLDMEKTMFVENTDAIIRPFFSLLKINHFAIFHIPQSHDLWKITSGLYINEVLKKAIQKEKLTGVSFEKTRVI
ncbi:hypothetical protein MuYL_0262 [Mucilaginibacter xinganensis]|uniref:Immunity MXAN-0049 protein domain-containing protein n=2 Tax=Mucilaginibacter xinganensis TaxID=1234841 RepID=A0A223NQH4_9SPHI|nr:hypothetical protein MuYL_0262 [Mucilaginibacter xinganensis]